MENLYHNILVQGFGAFAGAFFAFLFLRLAEFFSKIYSRQVQHYNSLVMLETQLNEIGGIIHDNLYIIPTFAKVIVSGNVYFNNLHKIPIDKSHYQNLYDINLLNELFEYYYQLRKINDDIETMAAGYSDIKNALIQGHINQARYKVNAGALAETLKTLEIFLADIQEQTVKLMARVSVQIKGDIPLGTKLQRMFIHTVGDKLKQEEIDRQVKKLSKEIEETKTKSQKQIEEVLKKYKQSQPQ